MTIRDDIYWASVPTEELPAAILAKATAFRERLEREGRIDVWRASERTYYGLDGKGGWSNSVAVTYGGDDGELVLARVNHYRSIVQAVIAMVTGARPTFKARSVNTDVKSLAATSVAEGVVDYTYRSKKIEGMRVEQVERAIVSGEGYMHLRWDIHAGRTAATIQRPVYGDDGAQVIDEVEAEEASEEVGEDGQPVVVMTKVTQQVPRTEPWPRKEGDIAPAVLGPLEVIRDLDDRSMRYAIVPFRVNAWDLAARYPQHRADVLALRGKDRWPRQVWSEGVLEAPESGDDTAQGWLLYHPPCDALPSGRYAIVAGDITFADEEWKFDPTEIPVYPLVPMHQMGTGSGHSPMWDLLCLQELYDACFSALGGACEGRGIGNVIAPKGSDVQNEMLSRAFQLIEYDAQPELPDGGKPTPLTGLFDLPADSYKILEILQRTMETLSGVNSVMRGDPDSNLKSGAALALVQSLGVHFNSTTQGAVTLNDEAVGTGILKLYQRFSPLPRLAEIVGQNKTTALKEFTEDELRSVQRVTVEMSNPATRQGGGALEIALDLLKAGVIKDVSQFYEIVETGRAEPVFDEVRDESRQLRRENEQLAAGKPVKVSATDRDNIHIKGHRRILDDPDVREDDEKVRVLTEHIQRHLDSQNQKSLELMWSIGQEVPPWRIPPPVGAPPPPGGPSDAPAPSGSSTPLPAPRARPLGGEPPPGGPQMPVNPLDGERVPAAGPQ